jgi:hypothetical protein
MVIGGLGREAKKIVEKFEFFEKSGNLTVGSHDDILKEFILKVINLLIKYNEDDEKYFEVMDALDFFMLKFVYGEEKGEDWAVFSKIDFSRLSEISSGVIEEVKFLEEVREYYS